MEYDLEGSNGQTLKLTRQEARNYLRAFNDIASMLLSDNQEATGFIIRGFAFWYSALPTMEQRLLRDHIRHAFSPTFEVSLFECVTITLDSFELAFTQQENFGAVPFLKKFEIAMGNIAAGVILGQKLAKRERGQNAKAS